MNLTPKEKAAYLIVKYMSKVVDMKLAKECALVCCDEVLGDMGADRGYSYWVEVKQEIEKLKYNLIEFDEVKNSMI